jgi:hypothetical protein
MASEQQHLRSDADDLVEAPAFMRGRSALALREEFSLENAL